MLRKAIWMLLGIGAAGNLFSQNLTRSPYSGFGTGDLQFYGFAHQQAMGRITQTMRGTADYSIANPASYSALKYTSYQAGLNASLGTIENSTVSQKTNTVALGYFSLGLPINPKRGWGGAFGLTPYSAIGFKSSTSTTDTTTGSYTNIQEGSGGLNRFYMGMGKTLFHNVSIGFNASYIFGQLVSTEKVYFNPDSVYLDYREDRTRFVGGFNFDIGLQYHDTIYRSKGSNENKWILNIGATYHMGSNLATKQELYARTVYQYLNNDYRRDTAQYLEGQKGTLSIPAGFSAGIGFTKTGRKNLWFVGAEYHSQQWSSYTSFGQNAGLKDLTSISLGATYQPLMASQSVDITKKYLKHIQYRAGIRYSNTQIVYKNKQISEYGINFGLGFPVKPFNSFVSYINFGVEYNSRGLVKDDLIRENYFRFFLGLSITDKWFVKYKYE